MSSSRLSPDRLANTGTKFLLASGVVGTVAWCGVLTYLVLTLVL